MDKRSRRSFTPEFKAEAVALVRSSGKATRQVARDLGLAETSLQRWVAQAEIDAGHRDGLSTAEREELSQLRRELRVDPRRAGRAGKSHRFLRHQRADPVSYDQFIAAEKAQHSVALLCRVVGSARSAFYAWLYHRPSAHQQRDAALVAAIQAIHADRAGT